MNDGNTAMILNPFLIGLKEVGAEVETFFTKKMNINPCRGCYHCLFQNPGICVQKDDMDLIIRKLIEADVWVFATPLHFAGMTASLKNALDRMQTLMGPDLEIRGGHSRMSVNQNLVTGKIVLVSTSGLWETDNFYPLVVHIKHICQHIGRDYAGALLRPHSRVMKPMMTIGTDISDIFDAATEAGRQLGIEGMMNPATIARVGKELVDLETYVSAPGD